MQILITGATGLVGTHITRVCRQKGIAVNYLTTSREKIRKEANYNGFYWNPEEGEIDEECFKKVDAIIHLAGASLAKRWTKTYKQEIINSRINSADLIFNTLRSSTFKIPHFISASAVGIYPSSLQKLYFEDETGVDDTFPGEVTEKWEAAADKFKELDMKVSKIRIGLVLAKDGGALPKMKVPVSYNAGAAFGSGKQWQSWIHIKDLAGIFHFVLVNKLEGIYNGVAPNPVTNKELMENISDKLGKSIWLPNIPEVVLKVALGEMSTVLFSSQLVSADKIQNTDYVFNYKNLPRALEELL